MNRTGGYRIGLLVMGVLIFLGCGSKVPKELKVMDDSKGQYGKVIHDLGTIYTPIGTLMYICDHMTESMDAISEDEKYSGLGLVEFLYIVDLEGQEVTVCHLQIPLGNWKQLTEMDKKNYNRYKLVGDYALYLDKALQPALQEQIAKYK